MKNIGLGAGRVMGKVRHRVCGLQELMFDGLPDSGLVFRTMERIKAEGYMPKLSIVAGDGLTSVGWRGVL